MLTTQQMQKLMRWMLLIGVWLSILLTLSGGIGYLVQFGSNPLPIQSLQNQPMHWMPIWDAAIAFSPIGLIQLGLAVLVVTQATRVGLLALYYAILQDYRFMLISLFLFLILLYSLSLA